MTKFWQIYYNMVFGAIGGLLAWLIIGLMPTSKWDVHLANGVIGAGIGLFIGGFLGAVDGLVIKRSALRSVTGAMGGAAAGLISGTVGLLLGGLVFLAIEGGLVARMLGWMALGLFLGLGQGLLGLKAKRALYGLAGGLVAGLVGGALYEIFTQAFIEQSGDVQVFLSAAGLILLGVSLGSIIPLSVGIIGGVLAQRGLVVILAGHRANTEVEIIGSATAGSSDACDIYIRDAQIEQKQAEIRKGATGFEIQNIGSSRTLLVNQAPLYPGHTILLTDGAQIQMGESRLEFRAR